MNPQYIPKEFREPIERVRGLPGADIDNRSPYKNVFFGADREYGENEGWVKVTRHKRNRKSKIRDQE